MRCRRIGGATGPPQATYSPPQTTQTTLASSSQVRVSSHSTGAGHCSPGMPSLALLLQSHHSQPWAIAPPTRRGLISRMVCNALSRRDYGVLPVLAPHSHPSSCPSHPHDPVHGQGDFICHPATTLLHDTSWLLMHTPHLTPPPAPATCSSLQMHSRETGHATYRPIALLTMWTPSTDRVSSVAAILCSRREERVRLPCLIRSQ